MRIRSIRPIVTAAILVGVAAAGPARAAQATFTEDFDNGSNVGGWTFGNTSFETIEPSGGRPGAYLHNVFLDSFAAQPRTTLGVDSPFVGDYRARKVRAVGIDLALFSVDFSSQGRPLSVLLFDDGGTPDDSTDDCRVYTVGGHPTPMPNGAWQPYRFRVPSDSSTIPNGWEIQGCSGLTADEAWNRVITGVDQLRFFTGDPDLFFIFQVWNIGLDNPTIVFDATQQGG